MSTQNNAINKASNTLTATTVYSTTFDTNVAAAKLQVAGTTITATGSDANVGLTVTPKGSGAITVTTGAVTLSSGNINLPDTTSTTVGSLLINSEPFLHGYGVDNTFAGYAGNYTLSTASGTQGGTNVCIGKSACSSLDGSAATTACRNVAIGVNAFTAATDCRYCTAIGYNALNTATGSGTYYNVALGYQAGYSSITTNSQYNVFLGANTGDSYSGSESSNILIGYGVTGTNGESNVLRIGTATGTGAGELGASYISGIYNINADSGGTPHAVYVGSGNKLGKNPSSRTVKKNIVDMTGSEAIYDLRPVNFNYISDELSQYKQYGLIAEEVAEVLPELAGYDSTTGDPDSVRYEMLPVLLLNEIKKLQDVIDSLSARLDILGG